MRSPHQTGRFERHLDFSISHKPLECYGNVDGDELSVLSAIIHNRDKVGPFRFDCGTDDLLIDSNRELARSLDMEGIQFLYEENPGGHEWSYWGKHVLESYRFFAGYL